MAEVAALVGDPGRASMLAVMMDGRAHTAGELAVAAGVTAPTTSGHLAKLLGGQLIAVAAQGRHRYYRIASEDVARMLESIMVVTAEPAARARATPLVPRELREARSCYDHLAGRLGVTIANTLTRNGAVKLADGGYDVTDHGAPLFKRLGIDLDIVRNASSRPLCRPCLDWSEREPHLAGVLGAAILARLIELGWIERMKGSRAIGITRIGSAKLKTHFGYVPL